MKAKLQNAHAVVCCVFTLSVCLSAFAQTVAAPTGQQASAAAQRSTETREPSAPAKGTAIVEFRDGLLHIAASDADLNSVLQQVARVTGMHLQGSTSGDRVFGDYGPAAASEVLNHLLDGVPCNFVMTQEPGTAAPQQLVISARNGGGMNAEPVPANRTAARRAGPVAAPQGQVEQPEQGEQAEPAEEVPAEQAPEIPNSPPTAEQPTDDNKPNAVKTPQQFMEELNRMHQQARPQ